MCACERYVMFYSVTLRPMKRVVLCLLLLLSILPVGAGEAASDIRVSVLTCSPGQEVYSLYGHTAIRVQNLASNVDAVFNYGIFDFASKHFVWNFVLGKTDYRCDAVPWEYFLLEYRSRGSAVVEQVLNLEPEEAKAISLYLYNNVRPENSVYRYNYLTNNCTTRVMDCVEACIGGSLSYSWGDTLHTYRSMMHEYTEDSPWAQEGNDVLLGANVDTVLSHRATCFLPEYYCRALAGAVVRDDVKDTRRLVKETIVVLESNENIRKAVAPKSTFPLTPLEMGCIVLGAVLLVVLLEMWLRKMLWPLDALLMLVHGLAGCFILFVFLFSAHPTLDSNWLVLVLNPLPLVALPYVVKAAWRDEVCYWHHFMAVWLALFLLFLAWMPQRIGTLVILTIAALMCRQVSYLLHYGRMEGKKPVVRPKEKKKRKPSKS